MRQRVWAEERSMDAWKERLGLGCCHLHALHRRGEGDDRRREDCDIWVEHSTWKSVHPLAIAEGTPSATSLGGHWIHGF